MLISSPICFFILIPHLISKCALQDTFLPLCQGMPRGIVLAGRQMYAPQHQVPSQKEAYDVRTLM